MLGHPLRMPNHAKEAFVSLGTLCNYPRFVTVNTRMKPRRELRESQYG